VSALPPLALYVHIPWCAKKCPYCDFNSHATSGALPEKEYIAAVLADLDAELEFVAGRMIGSVFVGGGTPSLLSVDALAGLLAGIDQRLGLATDTEITLEANPGSSDAGKFSGFRAAGVTRLSVGVQSFDDACLRALGRIHDAAAARAALEAARKVGFSRLNIDLMHGLPGQSPEAAIRDLEQALGHGSSHISWYQLTIEPNTAFFSSPPVLPDEDTLAEIQAGGHELLQREGYLQYEVSAYARPGHACRHNLNYWQFGDYIGIGAGAHGKLTLSDGRVLRTSKSRVPRDYMGGEPRRARAVRTVSPDEIGLEFLMNALRLREGVPAALYEARTGLSRAGIASICAALREEGLLLPDPERLCATPMGYRYLDAVLARLA